MCFVGNYHTEVAPDQETFLMILCAGYILVSLYWAGLFSGFLVSILGGNLLTTLKMSGNRFFGGALPREYYLTYFLCFISCGPDIESRFAI